MHIVTGHEVVTLLIWRLLLTNKAGKIIDHYPPPVPLKLRP